MKPKTKTLSEISLFILLPVFFAAGFLNGFSGAGGGMVLGLLMPLLLGEGGTRRSFSYITLSVFLFSLTSALIYLCFGRISFAMAKDTVAPSLLGGALGGLLLQKIDPILLKSLFAVLLLYAGVRFLWA